MSETPNDNSRMSLIEHLEELRKRIIISAIALAVTTSVCFAFKGYLLEFLLSPLGDRELLTLGPTESFMTVFRVSFYAGLIIASPVIIYQIWVFVAPGLRKQERRALLFASLFTTVLFLGGVAFAWFLVLPRGLDFLLNYESDTFNQQVQAARYFSFVIMFLLGFGIVFDLPAMVLSLARLGIVSPGMLRKHRKYVYLGGAVISAVLTPGQDVFSMIAMVVPFVLLFEMSVLLSRYVYKAGRREESEAEGPEGTGEAAG